MVQTLDDVLDELPLERTGKPSIKSEKLLSLKNWREEELDDLSKKICGFLEQGEVQIDALGDELNVNTGQLLVTLLQLEMRELVQQKAGKVFTLK